eukprot:7930701-Pyramimonas_sp.AAC.1
MEDAAGEGPVMIFCGLGIFCSIVDGFNGEVSSLSSRWHLASTGRGCHDGPDARISATSPSRSSSPH